ncbi:MAG: sodium:calcium antiporter [Candidatus Hodarchaeota archaeon]
MLPDLFFWIILFIIGYIVIYYSADYIIDVLEDLIEMYTISPLIVGLFILGIDLEESIVSLVAAIDNLPYLSLGNLIGNTIIAITIAFALPTFFLEFRFKRLPSFYYIILFVGALSVMISTFFPQFLIIFAILNLIIFGLYGIYSAKIQSEFKGRINDSTNEKIQYNARNDNVENEEEENKSKIIFLKIIFVIGTIFIAGEVLIISSVQIVFLTGLSESFFGLIIMAFVTNVEEFWLIVNSIKKGQTELGISAQIGKIIWNIILIFGFCGLIIVQYDFKFIMMISSIFFVVIIGILIINLLNTNLSKQTGLILSFIFFLFLVINFYNII